MEVKFAPNNYQPTGVVSYVSWSNPDFHEAMRKLFGESPRERLVEVVIERDGIKARFESKSNA